MRSLSFRPGHCWGFRPGDSCPLRVPPRLRPRLRRGWPRLPPGGTPAMTKASRYVRSRRPPLLRPNARESPWASAGPQASRIDCRIGGVRPGSAGHGETLSRSETLRPEIDSGRRSLEFRAWTRGANRSPCGATPRRGNCGPERRRFPIRAAGSDATILWRAPARGISPGP